MGELVLLFVIGGAMWSIVVIAGGVAKKASNAAVQNPQEALKWVKFFMELRRK